MKRIITMMMPLLMISGIYAQEKADTSYWTKKGIAGLTLSQVSLTNWAAGGDGSIAFDLGLTYNFDYKKAKNLWQNRIELAYGLNNTKSNGMRKTNDKIYFSSTYGYNIAKNWYASALLTFNTQFANGYDYSKDPQVFTSQFMAPGYLSLGLGFTWTPKTWFKATFAPISWRGTFVMNDDLSEKGSYGVDPGKHFLNEIGGNIRGELNYDIFPNVNLYSRLDLFSNYLEDAQNVDVRWDIQLNIKINKWFSANAALNMLYDDNEVIPGQTGPRLQLRQLAGIGLQAQF